MAKPNTFYGTPLSKALQQYPSDRDDGPINRRKARLNQQQTVRDEQGRQRFHGAFTGGFSAGYFNTVDTVQGFKPRQFISRRGDRAEDGSGSRFSHRPEDYMDDEDLGEFGIAPKKLRVNMQYCSNQEHMASCLPSNRDFTLKKLLAANTLSIGEQILTKMRGNNKSFRRITVNINFTPKNDFHGLGYKPLSIASTSLPSLLSEKSYNPLTAVLKGGKRLKISGEAFGVGVLEEEEDCVGGYNAYGLDVEGEYDIGAKSSTKANRDFKKPKYSSSAADNDQSMPDYDIPPGFIFGGHLEMSVDINSEYPLPQIPDDWKMPVRSEPYVPPVDKAQSKKQLILLNAHQSSSSFNKKFTSAKGSSISDDSIEKRSGLVTYSDLKAVESKVLNIDNPSNEDLVTEASVVRSELEWRPCSLLCKHFNVPNPFPDNKFVGLRPPNVNIEESGDLNPVSEEVSAEIAGPKPASMELKRSIFDVVFSNTQFELEDVVAKDSELTDNDSDDPQIVEISDSVEPDNKRELDFDDVANDNSCDDQDIVAIVAVPKPEPEVIVLSDSTSVTPDNSPCTLSDNDTYGPPLPPPPTSLPQSSGAAQPVDSDVRRKELRHKRRKKKKDKKYKSR